MKVKKILILALTAVLCVTSLSFVTFMSASEPAQTKTPSEMFAPSLIYTGFAEDKVIETAEYSADDWKTFASYTTKANIMVSEWDTPEDFFFPFDITTYYRTTDKTPVGAILYVIGHMIPRVGTESDVDIINDYLDEGYVVSVVDFLDNENTVNPYIDAAVGLLRYEYAMKNKFIGDLYHDDLKYDTFVLPAGYRMVRNIEYFDVPKQAAEGTLEYIVTCYNKAATKNTINNSDTGVTWAKAETLDDVIMPNGLPINDVESGNYDKFLKYRLDIYYPSNPDAEIPLFVLASSSDKRAQFNSTSVFDRLQGPGSLFRGYALAVYDHEYTSFMLGRDSWGHIDSAGFTLQSANGVKTHTAAIRCLKYYAEDYGYSNEIIGVMGHSKSSYVVTLSGNDPYSFYESSPYTGYNRGASYGDQPHLTYRDGTPISSDITCVYHSMGAGSINRRHFLTSSNIPTFIACGVKDNANPAPRDYWEEEFNDYQALGIPFAGVYMPEVGHSYPPYVVDTIYGYNYYNTFWAFFDYYLKGEAPQVMYTGIEVDGTVDTDDKGLFIYFSAPITEWSLLKSVSVKDANGREVEGTWLADCGNTRWIFNSDDLVPGQQYTLTLKDTAADINGTVIKEGFVKSFTVK